MEKRTPAIEDAAARRYTVASKGWRRSPMPSQLIERFKEQSALERTRTIPANAAQIDRRARADAELLTSLLQSDGYYDSEVEPGIGLEGDRLAVELRATPGPRTPSRSVELQGLESAGERSAKLRDAFAVKAGDPVVADKVIAAGVALKVALGEEGFALAEVGEQDIVLDHQTATARLVLPVRRGRSPASAISA